MGYMGHDKNRSIDLWFPTAIYKEFCSDFSIHNSYLENKTIKIFENLQGKTNTEWRCDTFNTLGTYNYLEDNDEIVLKLIERARTSVLDFSKKFGVNKSIEDLELKDFWFNISGPESYQEYHQHALSHFSVVYYINAPENSGNIVFQSFENILDMHPLPIDRQQMTDFSYKTCFYEPVNSMMLIFKSNVLHMVEKNKSDKNRISVAMNFKFKGL